MLDDSLCSSLKYPQRYEHIHFYTQTSKHKVLLRKKTSKKHYICYYIQKIKDFIKILKRAIQFSQNGTVDFERLKKEAEYLGSRIEPSK